MSIQLAEAALSPQKLGGSGRRDGVAARSRDVEMIGVLTVSCYRRCRWQEGPYAAGRRAVTAVEPPRRRQLRDEPTLSSEIIVTQS